LRFLVCVVFVEDSVQKLFIAARQLAAISLDESRNAQSFASLAETADGDSGHVGRDLTPTCAVQKCLKGCSTNATVAVKLGQRHSIGESITRPTRSVDVTGKFNTTKLEVSCKEHQPRNWKWRTEQGVKHNDLILRCKAFLPPDLVDQALCINSSRSCTDCKTSWCTTATTARSSFP
jgi:hypothetical protein